MNITYVKLFLAAQSACHMICAYEMQSYTFFSKTCKARRKNLAKNTHFDK